MPDLGRSVLGTYSAACETLRGTIPPTRDPQPGDIIFFSGTRHSGANHIGIIYDVNSTTIYTIEGNTSGAAGVIDNGGCVAAKSYSRSNGRILSYARPTYTTACPASKVVAVAQGEIGYIEKASNADLESKTANAGSANYTKYGAWLGVNGNYWCASFISWCFHSAFDDSAGYTGPSEMGSIEATYVGTTGVEATSGGWVVSNYSVRSQSWGNSSLVGYVNRLSTGAQRRTSRIDRVTVHIARSTGDIMSLATMLANSTKCYNYGIDSRGNIGLFADEIMWTNSSDSSANDKMSMNIVCANSTLAPNYEISSLCKDALIDLLEDVCRRNFIFKLACNGNKDDTLTLHKTFNPESDCPGPYLSGQLKSICATVNKRLGAKITTNYVQVGSKLADSRTSALRTQSTLFISSIRPYVMQPSPTLLGIDYEKAKILGVVGTMLYAGQLYGEDHKQVDYRTENIYKQCEEAVAGEMPFGLIYTTRANNVEELRKEAYWFYFVVSKYRPKLGVWLKCRFTCSSDLAQYLVDEWYEFFVDWGLKSKCGLYCTKAQADKIGWPLQSSYMPLWLEGELTDSVCPDTELLTPTFFQLGDLTNYGITAEEAASYGSRAYVSGATAGGTINRVQEGTTYTAVQTAQTVSYASVDSGWTGRKLTKKAGTVAGPSGKETYYDLDMYKCVEYMRALGYNESYWEREDGCKMYGPYIMVAADLGIRPKGTILPCSLGMAMVCDTGTFAQSNQAQLDVATNWTKGPHYWEQTKNRWIS